MVLYKVILSISIYSAAQHSLKPYINILWFVDYSNYTSSLTTVLLSHICVIYLSTDSTCDYNLTIPSLIFVARYYHIYFSMFQLFTKKGFECFHEAWAYQAMCWQGMSGRTLTFSSMWGHYWRKIYFQMIPHLRTTNGFHLNNIRRYWLTPWSTIPFPIGLGCPFYVTFHISYNRRKGMGSDLARWMKPDIQHPSLPRYKR